MAQFVNNDPFATLPDEPGGGSGDQIKNFYYVGPGQPYKTVNKAIEEIAIALYGGNFTLPPNTLPDGGQVNIVIRGAGKHLPFSIPDNTTTILRDFNRYLIIKREEYTSLGKVVDDALPIFSPTAKGAGELPKADLLIGCNIGNNNPNVKIQGIRVEGFVIGIRAGFNCDNLYIQRSFITNCINAQIYISDSEQVYLTNNIAVGGQFGIVAKFCRKLRAYHNTVFVDGATALNGESKAGFVIQGERLFGSSEKIYFLGNLSYTIGCPAVIFYDEDLRSHRLISNYNDFFTIEGPLVQLRSDASQLSNESEIISNNFFELALWTQEEQLGDYVDTNNAPIGVDQESISSHPIFISTVNSISFNNTSILDLQLLGNSPLLSKVPSWYFSVDDRYIPSDFDEEIISIDSLLNTREQPYTAIGANDSFSLNGFFGQDIFTSPLGGSQSSSCDVDPLNSIAIQNIDMIYPELLPGYFYSHERKYYLYAKKGAFQLGHLIKAKFLVPGFLHHEDLSIKIRGNEIPKEDWDLSGRTLIVYTRTVGVIDYSDEVQISGFRRKWNTEGLQTSEIFYKYRLSEAELAFVLPDNYKPTGPVVITDDRVNYRDPIEVVRRDFKTWLNPKTEQTEIIFGGNKNYINNPQFDKSPDGINPSEWSVAEGTEVNIVNTDFAYIGDYACALMAGSAEGIITSNPVRVVSGENLTYSFHSMLPQTFITSTLEPVTSGNIDVKISFYDADKDILSGNSYEYQVPVKSDTFTRYYLTIGEELNCLPENLFEAESAPLQQITTGLIPIPIQSLYSTITISSRYNSNWDNTAFVTIDGVMAEHSKYPTAYNQETSPLHMTVEFETSDEGKFIDRRMNLSPILNENPNGFLYISDMPASIWGGPEDIEVTTLHEYRWPEGRINTLPWARIVGKDKLTQKSFFSSVPTKPIPIIEPFEYPKEAVAGSLVPATIIAAQDDLKPYGFVLQITDTEENPYALRNYTLSIYEQKDQFPGWLSKTYLGAKEQLGTTIYGSLSEHGSAVGYYIPPESNSIRYTGPVPKPLVTGSATEEEDYISFVQTNYGIAKENNGNVTIRGQSGNFFKIEGEEIEGSPSVSYDVLAGPYILMQYPPVLGTVELYINSGKYIETVDSPNNNEYLVDYNNAQIFLSKSLDPLSVTSTNLKYIPKYAYKDPKTSDTIIFHHNKIFGSYNDYIEVDYDANIFLEIATKQPISGEFVDNYNITLQNPRLPEAQVNGDSLDF